MNCCLKSALVCLVAALLILSFSTISSAVDLPTDIEEHWAQEQIEKWRNEDLASGYPDGTFRPDDEVTRAEFVSFMMRVINSAEIEMETETDDLPGFTDVEEGDWYYEHVSAAVKYELLAGYPDETFRPGISITREEAAVIVSQLQELEDEGPVRAFTDKEEISNWAESAVSTVIAAGIMAGYHDDTFRPGIPITRAEAVTALDQALEEITAENYDVTFQVLDEAESALEDAEVELNGYSGTTGEEGLVLFEGINKGSYDYRVEGEGYPAVEEEVKVEEALLIEVKLSKAVEVESRKELKAAVEDENVDKIIFAGSIEADITFQRPLTIDFNEYTLYGNVVFEHEKEDTSEVFGYGSPSIDGDLIVNTPRASFINNLIVSGTVNINALPPTRR